MSKTEWRTNQDSTERPRPNKQLRRPLRPLPQSAFAAATSSHDPNPILQSSDPDSDKTRSAATAARKLRHQELTFGACTSLGCRNLLSPVRPLQHSRSSSNRCVGQVGQTLTPPTPLALFHRYSLKKFWGAQTRFERAVRLSSALSSPTDQLANIHRALANTSGKGVSADRKRSVYM